MRTPEELLDLFANTTLLSDKDRLVCFTFIQSESFLAGEYSGMTKAAEIVVSKANELRGERRECESVLPEHFTRNAAMYILTARDNLQKT